MHTYQTTLKSDFCADSIEPLMTDEFADTPSRYECSQDSLIAVHIGKTHHFEMQKKIILKSAFENILECWKGI